MSAARPCAGAAALATGYGLSEAPSRQSALAPGRLADLAEDAAPCRGLIAAGGRRGECGWPERRRGEDRDSDRLGGVGLKVKKS